MPAKTNSQRPKIESRKIAPSQSENRNPARASRSAPKKILSVMSGLMDIMVDGLAPGVKTQRRSYDLVVVGAGPAGTSAAICAASQGVDTLIVYSGEAQDRAQFIECLDNCAANPTGITLETRAELAEAQGRRFLLEIRPGLSVTGFHSHGTQLRVETNRGYRLDARSIILAPGLHRHRLNIKGEDNLAGAGVYSCAHCDGSDYVGKDLMVVGSGDSGIEQALFLATLAKSVTVVEKDDRAQYNPQLYQMVNARPNISIKLNSIVRAFKGENKLRSVLVENAKTGEIDEMHPAAVFISIGLEPATDVFRSSVDLDPRGLIKTNGSMQTSLPGVFAAGHARTHTIRDAEDAASEGYRAGSMVRKYLDHSKR